MTNDLIEEKELFMKTISVTKTYAVLDEEDIEKAASSYLGRDVKIEELDLQS